MKQVTKLARQAIIFVAGVAVFILGLVLIPLPGPGILICLGGLVILSTEFAWARRHRDQLREYAKRAAAKVKAAASGQPRA